MSDKLFSIYRSSAGSGKTRTLAKEYLKLALRFRADYYKHILAVTFTNKATQEMKTRILHYLDTFAKGTNDSLAVELMRELNLDAPTFKERTNDLRSDILHNYSQFSINTIDAFFQKVIRSFTREAGLSGDYRLEVDQAEVIEEVVDKLVDELGSNEQLTRWIIEYAKENLENDKPWDVRGNLIDFTKEIFREEFRAIEDELARTTADPDYFKKLQTELRKTVHIFTGTVKNQAKEALTLIHKNGWTRDDFKYSGGPYTTLLKFSSISSVKDMDEESIGKRPRKEYAEARHWPDKETPHAAAIEKTATDTLIPVLQSILEYRDAQYKQALSAEVVLTNFYAFGLVADLSRKMREYKEENNIMLLADAPKFLNGIIQDSDTPFIYEKVGSFYRNYLIDEFQDTSGMQWNNFKPLLLNSLDQGYPGLVVGDVKQSIYRWRGGDLQLLQQDVEQHIGPHRVQVKELSSNFRSATHVIDFNNAFFEMASSEAEKETGAALVRESYSDVAQKKSRKEDGFVKVQFIKPADKETGWKEETLSVIPSQLEQLQDAGVKLSDVAILVRNNLEGVEVAEYLLHYKEQNKNTAYRYDVISNESLRLDGAVSVNIIISALRYLVNSEDVIARAQLSYDYGRLKGENVLHDVFAVTDKERFKKKLPLAFVKEQAYLKKLPLFEITETLIEIFGLGNLHGELAYLQTFQNLVLDFYTRERNDISAFLLWWEENSAKKSIQISGQVEAVQILSIHKSKGLQFKYVLLPFCSWEIDHAPQKSPTLWVKTKETPFTQEAYVPVKYTSSLTDTIFADDYAQEKTRTYLDNLNLLYVAFTRAEQGLLILAPHPEVSRIKGTVANILYNCITRSAVLSALWNENTNSWQKGVLESQTGQISDNREEAISLVNYEVSRWRNRMVLRKKAENIFRKQEGEFTESRKRGLLVHAIFSRIRYVCDVDTVLQEAIQEGLITQVDFSKLKDKFNSLLSNAQIASWFDETWEVKTEIPILLPDRNDVRIDRMMIRDNQAIVVDYKTGEPKPQDEEQVAAYIKILHEMNIVNVEGYLLYLNTGRIQRITEQHMAKKKTISKDQLGLGL